MSELKFRDIVFHGAQRLIRNRDGKLLASNVPADDNRGIVDDSFAGVHGSLRPHGCDISQFDGRCNLRVFLDGLHNLPDGEWWLIGRQGSDQLAKSEKKLSKASAHGAEGAKWSQPDVNFRPRWARKDFPWGFAGDVTWELRRDTTASTAPISLRTTRLEIYAIRYPLPVLFGGSVDVNFLRTVVLPAANSSAVDWPRYIAKAMFWDYGFRYKSYGGGAPSYASGTHAQKFHLRRWTRDAGKNELVNCYDQAGIVYIALNLAPTHVAACKIAHLKVYGYINKTELIGRGFTNNPFPSGKEAENRSDREGWIVDRNYKQRSKFSNHSFVRLTDKDGSIIDACAGPHIGRETLQQYIDAAISTRTSDENDPNLNATTLYNKNELTEYPGTVDNVELGDVLAIDEAPIPSPETCERSVTEGQTEYSKASMQLAKSSKGISTDSLCSFKLSQISKLLSDTSGYECTPDVRVNKYGAHVTYDIPYFLSDGIEKDQIDVQVVVLKTNQQARNYFEWDLHNYHNTDPEKWKKLYNPIFAAQLSLAADGKHGVVIWVRGQIFVRIEGYPISEQLWETYGKPLDDIFTSTKQSSNTEFKASIQPHEVKARYQPTIYVDTGTTRNMTWMVMDITDKKLGSPNYTDLLLPIDWEWQDRGSGFYRLLVHLTACDVAREHTLRWVFASHDNSMEICTVESKVIFSKGSKASSVFD